jgi:hypothetical protein
LNNGELEDAYQAIEQRKKEAKKQENQTSSVDKNVDQVTSQVSTFLQTIQRGRTLSQQEKQQGITLLQQVEKLKKEAKKSYRAGNRNIVLDGDIDIGSEVFKLIQEKNKQYQDNLQILRQLRKQLKTACKLNKEELTVCKVKVKQQEEGYQTDSSDEEMLYSETELGFKRGLIRGIGQGLKNAPRNVLESFADLVNNPIATIEGIIEGLSNLPEVPGLIFEYLETIEGNEEAKGQEIAEFIVEQLTTILSPNKVKLLQMGKLSKAIRIVAKDVERIVKLAKKYGLNANSVTTRQLLENFDMKALDWIAKYRKGSIKSVLKDVGDRTIGEIFEAADSQTRKLIMDGRFAK